MTAAALLTLALIAQDPAKPDPDAKLKAAWPALVAAWKGVTTFKLDLAKDAEVGKGMMADPSKATVPDSLLRGIGSVSNALEAAGLFGSDVPAELAAFKNVYKSRIGAAVRVQALALSVPKTDQEFQKYSRDYQQAMNQLQQEYQYVQMEFYRNRGGRGGVAAPEPKKTAVIRLEEAAAALARLQETGTPDEDLVQDALAKLRDAFRDLSIIDDETPAWMRARVTRLVRAAALGEPYPETPAPTADQEKQIDKLLGTLREGDLPEREAATREIARIAEPFLKRLREELTEATDPDLKMRLQRILGWRGDRPVPAPAPSEEDEVPPVKRILR